MIEVRLVVFINLYEQRPELPAFVFSDNQNLASPCISRQENEHQNISITQSIRGTHGLIDSLKSPGNFNPLRDQQECFSTEALMNHDKTTTTSGARHNPDAGAIGQLARLHDMHDYKVAHGEPHVRGWDVKTADGQKVGEVDDLIVDTNAMQVRYLDIKLDQKSLKLNEDRHVLLPISGARLDDHEDEVLLGAMTPVQLAALPAYRDGDVIATGTDSMPRPDDTRQFYGKRGGTGGVQRMTLSEEELKVGKRQKDAGEVDVRKSVETEHVSKKVPVSHEDVTVERRPVSADSSRTGKISEDEVRIPLKAEEAVVEKRTVPKEEVVIKKKTVAGEQKVEADLQHERVDVDRKANADRRNKS